jgi:hypothetical protein
MADVRRFDVLTEVAASSEAGRPAGDRLRGQALDLARERGLGRAACVVEVVALDAAEDGVFSLRGERFHAPRLIPQSGELTALAFGVCTLGAAISGQITALFAERRAALALALDGLGNAMVMEASRRLQDLALAQARKRGLTMAGELRPGDPGLALEAQPAVLRFSGAERIGVDCTAGLNLSPHKSASVVYGVGRDLPATTWSRCDDCRWSETCRARGDR